MALHGTTEGQRILFNAATPLLACKRVMDALSLGD